MPVEPGARYCQHPARVMKFVLCLAFVVPSFSDCRAQQLAEPLLRTPVWNNTICGLTGRWISWNMSHGSVARAWVGIVEDECPRIEHNLIRARNDALLRANVYSKAAAEDIAVADRAEEVSARKRHCGCLNLRYFDFALVEIHLPDDRISLRWAIDYDIDGSFDDESSHLVRWKAPDKIRAGCFLQVDPGSVLPPLPSLRTIQPARNARLQISVARPTSGTVVLSEPSTALFTDDSGELQELVGQLHQLDQLSTRKQQLEQIVATADRIIRFIDRVKSNADLRPVLIDALYRRGRALGYMELPDVVAIQPVAEPTWLQREFESNFQRLEQLVDTSLPEFVLLRIRRERRLNKRGVALNFVEHYRRKHPHPVWYHKKRFDLLNELGARFHAHQAAAELWQFARMPKRMVPLLIQLKYPDGAPDVLPVVRGSWLAKPPFRETVLSFCETSPGTLAAVTWIEPGAVYQLTGIPGYSQQKVSVSDSAQLSSFIVNRSD